MMMLIRKTILFLFLGFLLSANPQVNENMLRAGLRSGGFYRAWIFFNDKTEGESTSENVFQKVLDNLDKRTRMRLSLIHI